MPTTSRRVSVVALDNSAAESGTPPTNPAVFRITRVGNNAGDLTVSFTRTGTARFGPKLDDTLAGNGMTTTAMSVMIPAGADFVDLSVHPVDDALVEKLETVTLTLTPKTSYRIDAAAKTASATILDNEV